MQAIILAAGMGKRLKELTKDNTKCMVKVNGVTLIERMLSQLDKENLSRIIIVIGYEGKKLKNFISALSLKTPIEFVENPIYDVTNNIYSLYLAKEKLREEDTMLLESDLIFNDQVLKTIHYAEYPSLALVAKYENWMDGTVVTIDEYDNIKRFISKKEFKIEEKSFYFKTVNIYKFSKNFSNSHYIPFLEAYCKALGNNEYYEQVLKVITLLEKPEIKALRLENEDWYEIDDVQDLDIAESVFAPRDEKLQKIQRRLGGYWRYPSMKNFYYWSNPFFPCNALKTELKDNIDNLIGEYPSEMGIHSLLAAKNFGVSASYLCVGNGTSELLELFVGHSDESVGIVFLPNESILFHSIASPKTIHFIPSDQNFTYAAKDLIKYFENKNIHFLLVNNPDNISGHYLEQEQILSLVTWTKDKNIYFILDETFIDFATDNPKNTFLKNELLESFPNLILLKSISLSYGVSGIRLGIMATTNRTVIDDVRAKIAPWNINSVAEYYLQILGKYEAEYLDSIRIFKNERKRFMKALSSIEFLRVIPSQGAYILCEIFHKYTAKHLADHLLIHYNILVKDCTNEISVDNRQYIRIAIKDQNSNDLLLRTFKQL